MSLQQNPITNTVGLSTVMLAAVVSLLIASMVTPFFSISFEKDTSNYTIIGVQGSGTIGCLGACKGSNNNCIGDDATKQCQVVQAMYIIATILSIVGLIISAVADLKISTSLTSFMIKNYTFASFALMSMVMLIICMFIIFFSTEGFLNNSSIKEVMDKPEYVDYVHYKEAFYMSIVSIILLFFTTIVGYSSKNW